MAEIFVNALDFQIAVGVLGGISLILIIAIISLIVWIIQLQKKIQKMMYLANFKIKRPTLQKPVTSPVNNMYNKPPTDNYYQGGPNPTSKPPGFSPHQNIPKADYGFDNAGYRPSTFDPQPVGGGSSLNPIANRGPPPQSSFENGNFSFGGGPGNNANKFPSDNSRFASDKYY